MTIEVGSVVVLRSGSLKMVVKELHLQEGKPLNNNECAICGPYPRLESSEPQVMATMILAQQTWRQRHDAHAKLATVAHVTCSWMYDGRVDDGTFPVEALIEVGDASSGDAEAPVRPARKRPFRAGDEEG